MSEGAVLIVEDEAILDLESALEEAVFRSSASEMPQRRCPLSRPIQPSSRPRMFVWSQENRDGRSLGTCGVPTRTSRLSTSVVTAHYIGERKVFATV